MTDSKVARLERVERVFAGDNAWYKSGEDELIVAVGWALLAPHLTVVNLNGEELARYTEGRYV